MYFLENLNQAYISLKANKLRSILTMLGIIMGVFSVVAILAISNAAQVFMMGEFNKMGANTIIIQMNPMVDEDLEVKPLSLAEIDLIKEGVPEVAYASGAKVFYSDLLLEDGNRDAYVTGASSEYPNFQDIDFVSGRFISDKDLDHRRKVVIVPDTFAEETFGTTQVLGETIRIRNQEGRLLKTRIIGVVKTEDDLFASMLDGMEFPVEIIIPLTLSQSFYGSTHLDQINVSLQEGEDMTAGGEKIIRLLEFVNQVDGQYLATSVEDIQASVSSVLGVVSMVFLVIAIITLIVGGIGIINILLVSVTERIREIGLRKALGAQKKDIVLQFLTESMLMTGTSGFIGILLGTGTGSIISAVIKIPPVVDFKIISFTFLGSILLGIVFGVYPAKKAADLDPIDSLRYE